MATSQDNMFQESLVKFSYDREKEIIKGAKNPKSSPVVKNIHPNKFFETTNFNYSEKKKPCQNQNTHVLKINLFSWQNNFLAINVSVIND